MSFGDMMSSARGPGVIGTLMALAVMAIFVMFFVFAFDDRFQGGGKSIQSMITQQSQDIAGYNFDIAEGQKTLSGYPALILSGKDLATLKLKNEILKNRVETLGKEVESAKAGLAVSDAAYEGFKDKYRVFVRGQAKGEIIETLETQSGTVYKNANIREVTAIGIQIRHEAGQKRIPYEDLPEAMQDHFQFDPKQKAEAIAKEQAMWNEHENAVIEANDMSVQQATEKSAMQRDESRKKAGQSLAVIESRLRSLSDEIRSLESAIQAESQKAISRAPEMRKRLVVKQGELSELQAKVARLRASQ